MRIAYSLIRWSLVADRWSLIADHRSLITDRCLFR
jgi:hypothetical protein